MNPGPLTALKAITTPTERLNLRGSRILQFFAGFFLLYRTFTELPFAEYFWGAHGAAHGNLMPFFGAAATSVERLFDQPGGIYVILGMHVLAALGLMLGRLGGLCAFVAAGTFMLLNARNPTIGDGGDNLLQILLFYMVFLNTSVRRTTPLRTFFHNLAVYAIVLQVIVVYFTAGTSKLMGDAWIQGSAMYTIAQLQWFSLPLFAALFRNAYVSALACYTTIGYQVGFPFIIFTRFKLPAIALGIGLHLGILFMMGLVTFSSIMIACELILISDAEYARIGQALSTVRGRVNGKLSRLLPLRPARFSK
ncbi:HTTM domain-containing protein [Deinococcus aquiradiocola]|uniref:HTTM-like domain-containing protein n=1 Tax=Deinococcus aquiradiocola TaxID=393059 RepID=A0A917UMH9_9DEIO|nr:HTTM domain-containing protein [Deinococcus aquiradiocola]GGJ68390.1 hypothetical protein GCM10008939_11010 [Deinococcus aquiradiocola]